MIHTIIKYMSKLLFKKKNKRKTQSVAGWWEKTAECHLRCCKYRPRKGWWGTGGAEAEGRGWAGLPHVESPSASRPKLRQSSGGGRLSIKPPRQTNSLHASALLCVKWLIEKKHSVLIRLALNFARPLTGTHCRHVLFIFSV